MPVFFPPLEKTKSAGERHILFDEEIMMLGDIVEYDDARDGYVLAHGKTWDDYVRCPKVDDYDFSDQYDDEC